jgi:futalosine hydrolase
MNLLIVSAMENELQLIKKELNARPAGGSVPYPCQSAIIGDSRIHIAHIGVGVVQAALALGALITQTQCRRIIMVGSSGAFPDSGLEIGDVAVASSEILSELGVSLGATPGIGENMGIPGLDQEIRLDSDLADHLEQAARSEANSVKRGRFLTVVGVSGDPSVALARNNRFAPIVENMEGYALAYAGLKFGVSVGEARGVSNRAGCRDKSAWNLPAANEIAQRVVINYLRRTL